MTEVPPRDREHGARHSGGIDRRTVLKTLGAGVVGGTGLTGSAVAHQPGVPVERTWARDTEYELLTTEPLHSPDGMHRDDEGNGQAHRQLWIIAPVRDKPQATGHPNFRICHDHVVPLVDFSAQWHVKLVVEPGTENFDGTQLVNEDSSGTCLTSASAINAAESAGDVDILDTPEVFTCPIRPLKGDHPLHPCPDGNVNPGTNC